MIAIQSNKRPWHPEDHLIKLKRLRPMRIPRGYYDVLQINKAVSPAMLRKAFLKRAYETHPDRGGNDEDFCAVMEAYNNLHDDALRKRYDEHLTKINSKDGTWSAGDEQMIDDATDKRFSAAGVLLSSLMESNTHCLKSVIMGQQDAVLEALQHALVYGFPRLQPLSDGPTCGKAKHIRCKNGVFQVRLHHCSLEMTTPTTASFAQAVSWHVAMQTIILLAGKRLGLSGHHTQEGMIMQNPLIVPILLSEIQTGIALDPTLDISFGCYLYFRGHQYRFGQSHNLHLCLKLRKKLLELMLTSGGGAQVQHIKADPEVQHLLKQTENEHRLQQIRKREVLLAVGQALCLRQHAQIQGPKAIEHQPRALALLDVAHQQAVEKPSRCPQKHIPPAPSALPCLNSPPNIPRRLQEISDEVARLACQFCKLQEICLFRNASKTIAEVCLIEIEKYCKAFAYSHSFARAIGITALAPTTVARYLHAFFNTEIFAPLFVRLDLTGCPKAFFIDAPELLRSTFHRMRHLLHVSFPVHHICATQQKAKRLEAIHQFAQLLPKHTEIEVWNSKPRRLYKGRIDSNGVVLLAS